MYRKYFKRPLDIAAAVAGLTLASPLLLAVAAALALVNRGTPLFRQLRPGRGGKLFTILKFKTMNDRRDTTGRLLPASQRVHPLGRLLRGTSIDELPQMVNVLLGQMSFVGPRPLLPEYLPLYDSRQARRHEVRPGMTGLAQVSGRNDLGWAERFELDVRYVDTLTLRLDTRIVLLTLRKIFTREGVDADQRHTTPFDIS